MLGQAKWEKIIENEVGLGVDDEFKGLVQRASLDNDSMIQKSHQVMREVTKKIASSLASMLYEFYVVHKHDRFELDEATIGLLA